MQEWLVADGLGGYASGTTDGIRTRRYHAYLIVAAPHDERRFALVNDLELWVDTPHGPVALSSHRYAPDVIHPDGSSRLAHFAAEPWPTWQYDLAEGLTIIQQLFAPRSTLRAAMVLQWRLVGTGAKEASLRLRIRPLLSGRDFHALHKQNPDFRFAPERTSDRSWLWRPYNGVPPILVHANGSYRHEPLWFRNFSYVEERARGLDDVEDLASPGEFDWELGGGEGRDAVLILTVPEEWGGDGYKGVGDLSDEVRTLASSERARIAAFKSRLHHAADEYLVRRARRETIIAGYPWFTDWGRDTFIALRGLCLETGRLDEGERILVSWCDVLSHGMMPNNFPAHGREPQYNSVDASLWFVITAQGYLDAAARRGKWVDPGVTRRLTDAAQEILESYSRGTRYGIHADSDALLAAGEPGVALTWMDAVVNGTPVTPRVGKPVEVQALWVNALVVGSRWDERWGDLADEASESFADQFWNDARGCLFDVIDVDHDTGRRDDRIRPNQVFAVGGLRIALLAGERARSTIEVVERTLWTPMGLRTLAPGEPEYLTACVGPAAARDQAYHNGPAWPWLMGPFVDAWVRSRAAGGGPWAMKAVRTEARRKFLGGLARHLDEAGLGHVSELADSDEPWTPRGCPFQAWSVAELLRLLAD